MNETELLKLGVRRGLTPSRSAKTTPAFPLGLGQTGVHEVAETAFGDFPALTGFSLSIAKASGKQIAWVVSHALSRDHGHLSSHGLAEIMGGWQDILFIDTYKTDEALWVTEEILKSGAVDLAIAELPAVDFTASRRLTLASSRYGVPALLLLPYTHDGASTSTARWRLSTRPSTPNRLDPQGLGTPRWQATLERSRQAPHMAGQTFMIEDGNTNPENGRPPHLMRVDQQDLKYTSRRT